MISVMLADHERIFRIGLASALAGAGDVRIVGQPTTSEQLLRGLQKLRPQVLIVSSAFLESFVLIKQVCQRRGTAVLLLEDYGAATPQPFAVGFDGILRRSADELTVMNYIRQLAGGKRLVCSSGDSLQDTSNHAAGLRVRQRLTVAEREIVSCVVQGYKNREIASRLGTTEQSVKNALRRIFDKTGVYGRLELAVFVMYHQTSLGGHAAARPAAGVAPMAPRQWQWSGGPESTMH